MKRHSPAWFDRQRAHCEVMLAQLDGSISETSALAIHSFVSGSRKCVGPDLFTAPASTGVATGARPESSQAAGCGASHGARS